MYAKWLEFKEDPKNIREARRLKKLTGGKAEDYLLVNFGEKEKEKCVENFTDCFEIETCIFKDFPLTEQLKLIENFVPEPYWYGGNINEEVSKLIYLLWPKYILNVKYGEHNKSYPHKEIFECLYSIKANLKSMTNMNQEQLVKNGSSRKGNSPYYNWHLLGLIPLLKHETAEALLTNITKMRYNDAQDMLMFGLFQFDPLSFYSTLKGI